MRFVHITVKTEDLDIFGTIIAEAGFKGFVRCVDVKIGNLKLTRIRIKCAFIQEIKLQWLLMLRTVKHPYLYNDVILKFRGVKV